MPARTRTFDDPSLDLDSPAGKGLDPSRLTRAGPLAGGRVGAAYSGGMDRPVLEDALRDRPAVMRAFVAEDGSLRSIPTKLRKRLVVLDYLASHFDIGETWPESEVNDRLRVFHPDVASLRRYLVEEGFMERRDGRYWRAGGTVDL